MLKAFCLTIEYTGHWVLISISLILLRNKIDIHKLHEKRQTFLINEKEKQKQKKLSRVLEIIMFKTQIKEVVEFG